ncbi:retropepsin-like aspartic protease, partial [Klebsiella pneumoniae]|uniref:retropepsin-like aspartic protease n=1 Tax=Klebsiella pneumoniae TaxID=573 RepID=UPI003A8136F7
PTSMKLRGTIGDVPVLVMLDTGASHNFINDKTAALLEARPRTRQNFSVAMGNGQASTSCLWFPGLELHLQGHVVKVDMYVLGIQGADVVLGVQWLRTLGEITWDLSQMRLTFTEGGSATTLLGIHPSREERGDLRSLNLEQAAIWVMSEVVDEAKKEEEVPQEIREVLGQFPEVFEEPKGLPPPRAYDHHIELKAGTEAVSVRPYRYAHFQKAGIE